MKINISKVGDLLVGVNLCVWAIVFTGAISIHLLNPSDISFNWMIYSIIGVAFCLVIMLITDILNDLFSKD